MAEEIFGPVLSIHIYPDEDFERILEVCDTTSEYALTGSIFATDRRNIETAIEALGIVLENFYINDKPTGAVVGQQPFGGARGSGTERQGRLSTQLTKGGSALVLSKKHSHRHMTGLTDS